MYWYPLLYLLNLYSTEFLHVCIKRFELKDNHCQACKWNWEIHPELTEPCDGDILSTSTESCCIFPAINKHDKSKNQYSNICNDIRNIQHFLRNIPVESCHSYMGAASNGKSSRKN